MLCGEDICWNVFLVRVTTTALGVRGVMSGGRWAYSRPVYREIVGQMGWKTLWSAGVAAVAAGACCLVETM